MITMPTYLDLFGSDAEAVIVYKDLFPTDAHSDTEILAGIKTSFLKIEYIFGEFRGYVVGESTVRNEHIKRAVCFEANSILVATDAGSGLNNSGVMGMVVTSEKMEDVTTTYAESGANSIGSTLANTLGLLSSDASVILSRYIRKTYGWAMN